MKKVLLAVLCAFCMMTSNAEAYPSDYDARFQEHLHRALTGLRQVSQGRRLKFKGMNDSLQKTAQAVQMFIDWQVDDPVFSLLDAAARDYPENYFVLFLRALIFDLRGDRQAANRFFEEFLWKGRTYTDFEKTFISQHDFQRLRGGIEELLRMRGVSLKGQEGQLESRVPMQELENYRRHPAARDQVLNIAFLVVIFGGGAGLLLLAFAEAEFWRPPLRSFVGMYLAVWIAYGVWLLDLAFGLPYGISRFKVISVFLSSTAVLFVLREIIAWIQEKARPLETGFKRCPHCRAVIVELATECFYCKRPV